MRSITLACGFRKDAEIRRVLTLIRCGCPHPRLTHPAGLIGSSVPPLIAHDPIANLSPASYTFCATTNFLSPPEPLPPPSPHESYLFYRRLNSQRPSNFVFGSNIEPSHLFPLVSNSLQQLLPDQDHLLRRAQSSNYRCFSLFLFSLSAYPLLLTFFVIYSL